MVKDLKWSQSNISDWWKTARRFQLPYYFSKGRLERDPKMTRSNKDARMITRDPELRGKKKKKPWEVYQRTEMSCRKSIGITSDNVCLGRRSRGEMETKGRTQKGGESLNYTNQQETKDKGRLDREEMDGCVGWGIQDHTERLVITLWRVCVCVCGQRYITDWGDSRWGWCVRSPRRRTRQLDERAYLALYKKKKKMCLSWRGRQSFIPGLIKLV